MTLSVRTGTGKYDIICERGALSRVGELLNLSRKVLIVKGQRVVAALVSIEGEPELQPIYLGAADGGMGVAEDLLLFPVILPRVLLAEPWPQGPALLDKRSGPLAGTIPNRIRHCRPPPLAAGATTRYRSREDISRP